MVAEEVVLSLSGGPPWGFRLQGGAEHHRPLQVAKVRLCVSVDVLEMKEMKVTVHEGKKTKCLWLKERQEEQLLVVVSYFLVWWSHTVILSFMIEL